MPPQSSPEARWVADPRGGVIRGLVCGPSPARDQTQLTFALAAPRVLSLRIHDAGGRIVRRLVEAHPLPVGMHRLVWDGRNARGQLAPAGIYYLRLQAGDESLVRTIARIR